MSGRRKLVLSALCALSLHPYHAAEASAPELAQVEAYVRCGSEPDPVECRRRLPERFDTPFARVARGFALLLGPWRPGVDEVQLAFADFQWAADRGYFPAYEGMAMAMGRSDPHKGFEWLVKATASGMEAAADYLTDPRGPGSERLSQEDFFVYTCIVAHPASIGPFRPLEDMWAQERRQTVDFETVIARFQAARREAAAKGRGGFAITCAAQGPYFWHASGPALKAKQKRVRERLARTLKGIKQQLERFPELRLFSSSEDLNLLPTLAPSAKK